MRTSPTASLCNLLDEALNHNLIDFCYLTRKTVVLSLGGHPLSYAHEEARAFLRSLVEGWTRYQSGPTKPHEVPEPSRRKEEPVQAATAQQERPPATSGIKEAAALEAVLPLAAAEAKEVQTSEDYMDAVLAFAEAMRLIEGFDKDDHSHRVVLRTAAATTEMSYFETLEYLTTTILEELRADPKV